MSEPEYDRTEALIAVVGPCSSGKSTLQTALQAEGFNVRHVAQEHSYVPYMWQRMTNPDILIYLDVDYPTTRARRPHTVAGPKRLEAQHEMLAHAREHCDFYIDTSELTPEQVFKQVLTFLEGIMA